MTMQLAYDSKSNHPTENSFDRGQAFCNVSYLRQINQDQMKIRVIEEILETGKLVYQDLQRQYCTFPGCFIVIIKLDVKTNFPPNLPLTHGLQTKNTHDHMSGSLGERIAQGNVNDISIRSPSSAQTMIKLIKHIFTPTYLYPCKWCLN